jgi:hypothetical protein
MPIGNIENGELGSSVRSKLNATKDLAESAYKLYWFYVDDTGTNPSNGGTKITHSAGSATTFLTNNAAGALTTAYNPNSYDDVWDTSTNRFNLSSLKVGDILKLRVDLVVDHAAAQEITLVIDLAEGSAAPYTQNISHDYYVTATNGVTVTAFFETPLFSQTAIDNSARIRFVSPGAATVIVEGFYIKVTSV